MECGVSNTHKRLLEAHRLWHQCLNDYFDPEGFRVNLNATIQSLRNLTFALQAEKEKINGFDEWYKPWQDRMKIDPVMKWLNDARVRIVHQKDLETKSMAKVLIHGYYDLAEISLLVSPFLSSSVIAQSVKEDLVTKLSIPADQLTECIAVVERRWSANELPDWELLDALSYIFIFLSELVLDAHGQIGTSIHNCSVKDTLHILTPEEVASGRYLCMSLGQSYRTKQILLSDFSSTRILLKEINISEEGINSAKKRYMTKSSAIHKISPNMDHLSYVETLNEIALQILKKDKYHRSLFFMYIPDEGWKMHAAEPMNKSDKFMIMSALAQQIKKTKANCLIDIHEAWITSDIEALKQGIPVKETKNKKEVLKVTLVTSEGYSRTYTTIFKRGVLGNILLEETIVDELPPGNYLQPIIRIWKETR